MATQAIYYRSAGGPEPVAEFLDREFPLEPRKKKPSARELRCHYGRAHYRILYRRSGNLFVLLHMIRKTSRAVPPAEIEIARQRWQDFKERMEARPRKPPRAAGGDAP